MRRKLALGVMLVGVSAVVGASAQSGAAGPTGAPAVPSKSVEAPRADAPQAPPAQLPSANPATERSDPRQGIVRLERAGQPLGFGVVLRSDGRIITALSAVGHGNDVRARFSDGAVLPVAVVASDRKWDLALLNSQGSHWAAGLRPSAGEAVERGPALRRFRWRGGRLEETGVVVAARRSLIGRDGAVLGDMLLLQGRFGDDEIGSPLLDDAGEVLAIAIQACSPEPAGNCRMVAVGAPITVLKSFLKRAPQREPLPAAQLGFRGAAAHDGSIAGVRVLAVEPGSPAASAGLRASASRGTAENADGGAGDLIVAVDDVPVTTPEEMSDAINRVALSSPAAGTAARAAGTGEVPAERQVRLLVYGSGKFRQAAMPLRPLPAIQKPTPNPLPAAKPLKPPASQPPTEPPTAPAPASPSAPRAPVAPDSPAAPSPEPSAPSKP